MMKFLPALVAFIFPLSGWAEANVNTSDVMPTYLLQAPGTVTGIEASPPVVTPGNSPRGSVSLDNNQPLRYKSTMPDNHLESYKFPQYGQSISRSNPWGQEENQRRRPPALPPANPFSENPWDLSGRLPAQSNMGYQPDAPAYPSYYSGAGMDELGTPQGLYPDYPDSIYRDSNPASLPFFNGALPGLNDKGMDFPFMPFDMF